MAKVKLETWLDTVADTDELGRVLTYGDERIGHYFPEGKFMTIRAEYAELFPQAIGEIARKLGTIHATHALRDMRIVP